MVGTAAVGLVVGSEAVVEVDGGTIGFRLVGGTVGKAWWLLRRSAKLWRVRLGVLVVGDVFRLVVGSKLVGENDGDAVGGEVVGDVVGPVLGFEPVGDVDGDTFGVLGDVFDGVNACVRGVAGGSDGGHLRSGLSETRCHCSTLQHTGGSHSGCTCRPWCGRCGRGQGCRRGCRCHPGSQGSHLGSCGVPPARAR